MPIVTRGFTDNTLATRGYGKTTFAESLRKAVRRGRSAYGKAVRGIVVFAKLISVNDKEPDPQIVGKDQKNFFDEDPRVRTRSAAKMVGSKIKKTSEQIVIRVMNIFERKDDIEDGNS